MARKTFGGGAWVDYRSGWLPPEEADALLVELSQGRAWEQRAIKVFGREVMQPRLMDWAGALPYKYSGQTLPPRALEGPVGQLNERLKELTGVPFNHVVMNLYRDGRDSIGYHADDEPELGLEPVIASVSLGARRRFVLQEKRRRSRKRRFQLGHGSLLIMGGNLQHRWYHSVPKEAAVKEPRINLTFRWLRGPPGWRRSRA